MNEDNDPVENALNAVQRIQDLLTREENWSADTLSQIADILENAGFPVRDLEENNQ